MQASDFFRKILDDFWTVFGQMFDSFLDDLSDNSLDALDLDYVFGTFSKIFQQALNKGNFDLVFY